MISFNTAITATLLLCIAVFIPTTNAQSNSGQSASSNSTIPSDQQEKDVRELKAHMAGAAQQVGQFVANVVVKRMNDPATDISTKECLIVCQHAYDNAVSSVRNGLASMAAGDFYKAKLYVSAFTANINACDLCYSDFQKFDDWIRGVGSVCLATISKYAK